MVRLTAVPSASNHQVGAVAPANILIAPDGVVRVYVPTQSKYVSGLFGNFGAKPCLVVLTLFVVISVVSSVASLSGLSLGSFVPTAIGLTALTGATESLVNPLTVADASIGISRVSLSPTTIGFHASTAATDNLAIPTPTFVASVVLPIP